MEENGAADDVETYFTERIPGWSSVPGRPGERTVTGKWKRFLPVVGGG